MHWFPQWQWEQGGKFVSSPGFLQESPKRHECYTANNSPFMLGSQGYKTVTWQLGWTMAKRNGLLASNKNQWFNGLVGGNPSHWSCLTGKKLLFHYLPQLNGLATALTRNPSKFEIKVYISCSGRTQHLMAWEARDTIFKYLLENCDRGQNVGIQQVDGRTQST